MDIAPDAGPIDHFADQDGAAIAQLRDEIAELVAGIGHGDRVAAVRDATSSQDRYAFGGGQGLNVNAKVPRQRLVQANKPWGRDSGRLHPGKEAFGQPSVAVIECNVESGKGIHGTYMAAVRRKFHR
jgi:hypothetical protein